MDNNQLRRSSRQKKEPKSEYIKTPEEEFYSTKNDLALELKSTEIKLEKVKFLNSSLIMHLKNFESLESSYWKAIKLLKQISIKSNWSLNTYFEKIQAELEQQREKIINEVEECLGKIGERRMASKNFD
jgi:tetratricopeptide (TPR) repeat protein